MYALSRSLTGSQLFQIDSYCRSIFPTPQVGRPSFNLLEVVFAFSVDTWLWLDG